MNISYASKAIEWIIAYNTKKQCVKQCVFGPFLEFFYNIVARNRESGNTGRLQRNLYAILKFAEQHKNNDNS